MEHEGARAPDGASVAKPEGLRERKRRETREATRRAAIALGLEHGWDAVTVEMICDAAGISPRTFYNYFPSREAAVLGEGKPMPNESQVAAFVAARGVSDVEAFAVMMAEVWTAAEPDRELFRQRRTLLDATPELAAANMMRITEARAQYAGIVRQRLDATRPSLGDADAEIEAAMAVSIAMGALQVMARGWLAGDGEAPLASLIHDYFPRVRRLTQAPSA
ncbi:TetR family transcriptional regulator [Demequina aestuarii]|uniref:TetR family transcriptional regulator n=1 Tax=Demequina aestuarii TaxID=327095 RepID=UPI000ADA5BCF|nr:TetR family transcriptional regulator [Demequina aestuarii]